MKNELHIDFENSLGPWLGKTVKLIEYHLLEMFAKANLDLTKEQMIVLKKLSYEDGLSQNDLAFLMLRNKSSLTRLLAKMERKGYITRRLNLEDKRVKQVFITPKGREIFGKTKPIIRDIIRQMEQHIGLEEKTHLIKILKKIQNNFDSNVGSF